MFRILLNVILPLVLPIALYAVYVAVLRRRAQSGAASVPRWQEGPWPWLFLVGAGMLLAGLIFFRATTGLPPGTRLEAPRLLDGQVVPSHPVP